MKHFIVGAIAAAIAFYGLTRFLPQFVDYTGSIEGLIVLGVIFGVINGLIGPIVKTLSIPISMLTMGLAGILVNAGLLLLVAIIAQSTGFDLQIGDFPPDLLHEAVPHWLEEGIALKPSGRGCRITDHRADLVELERRWRRAAADLLVEGDPDGEGASYDG